jgi:hypothetical protein
MTAVRTRNGSVKVIATMGMVLMMAFFSACDILATDGARDAIANGREIREFEDQNLRPLEEKMDDLWVNEIEPRERELEDLRYQQQVIQNEVVNPLWDAQNDPWAPGGEAALLQEEFDELNRQYEVMQRQIDLEQRELDSEWQDLWGSNSIDPEYQILEDLRFEKQRELDRLYRFGNRPIDELWDQIHELNSSQSFANTDSQIESELINAELRRLYDLQSDVHNSSNSEVDALYERANNVQNELNNLYNFGWNPINEIYSEIERLQSDLSPSTAGTSTESIEAQIADLEAVRTSYIASRDAEVAAWQATLDAIGTDSTVDAAGNVVTTDNSERIAVLQGLIAALEADAAEIVTAKNAEKDHLAQQIEDKKAAYDQLIADAEAAFTVASDALLADAAVIDAEIDALEAVGGDDANAQIAILQPQYDALIAAEQAEEDELHVLVAGYEAEREAGVDELQVLKDAVEAEILAGLTTDIDAEIAGYQTELDSLLSSSTTTTTTTSGTQSAEDVQASIDSAEAYWNGLIDEITNKILTLKNELLIGSTTNETDSRIHNLKLQAEEMERELNAKIANLEAVVNELYNQANNYNSGQSPEALEIQRQIDELNSKLEAIWQEDSASGLVTLLQVQALEKQVRVLEEEREAEQYRLEEELWDLDDQLSLFYKDQNSDYQAKEAEFQARADALQQRRNALDEMRWALGDEQQAAWDAFEVKRREAEAEIRRIEEEEFGVIYGKIRELENELQVFYAERRDLENEIRAAQRLVEEKKRELEDKVFDALESAAGTVDEAGGAVLTATEESGPEIDEGTVVVPADGTAN